MSSPKPLRRIVTGLDGDGRSAIIIDGPAPRIAWSTAASPADNSGRADAGGGPFTFDIPVGGSQLTAHDFAPRSEGPWHATDTVDYAVIVSGEVTFVTEAGEAHLRTGDILVDRGAVHRWRNDSDAPCRAVLVLQPALPVGAGATITGEVG